MRARDDQVFCEECLGSLATICGVGKVQENSDTQLKVYLARKMCCS